MPKSFKATGGKRNGGKHKGAASDNPNRTVSAKAKASGEVKTSVRQRTHTASSKYLTLKHRVDFHAIDATSARRRGPCPLLTGRRSHRQDAKLI